MQPWKFKSLTVTKLGSRKKIVMAGIVMAAHARANAQGRTDEEGPHLTEEGTCSRVNMKMSVHLMQYRTAVPVFLTASL